MTPPVFPLQSSRPERHGSGPQAPPSLPAGPWRAPGASLFDLEEEIDATLVSFRSVWRRFFPRRAAMTRDRLRRQLVHPRVPAILLFSPSRPSPWEMN